jgi:hypothetical protein
MPLYRDRIEQCQGPSADVLRDVARQGSAKWDTEEETYNHIIVPRVRNNLRHVDTIRGAANKQTFLKLILCSQPDAARLLLDDGDRDGITNNRLATATSPPLNPLHFPIAVAMGEMARATRVPACGSHEAFEKSVNWRRQYSLPFRSLELVRFCLN